MAQARRTSDDMGNLDKRRSSRQRCEFHVAKATPRYAGAPGWPNPPLPGHALVVRRSRQHQKEEGNSAGSQKFAN